MITINLYFKQAWQLMKQNPFLQCRLYHRNRTGDFDGDGAGGSVLYSYC